MKVKWGGGMWEAKNDNQKEQKVGKKKKIFMK